MSQQWNAMLLGRTLRDVQDLAAHMTTVLRANNEHVQGLLTHFDGRWHTWSSAAITLFTKFDLSPSVVLGGSGWAHNTAMETSRNPMVTITIPTCT
jgi:hypothetical protein